MPVPTVLDELHPTTGEIAKFIGTELVWVPYLEELGPRVRYYSTVAAAIAATDLVDLQLIQTAGRISANDGGGNLYQYHLAGRPTADGGFYIDGTGGDDYLEATDKRVADIRQFGALGNGTDTEDDQPAIQAAVDAYLAVAECTEVFLPDGIYHIQNPIDIDCAAGNVRFRMRGNGGGCIIRPGSTKSIATPLLRTINTTTNGAQRLDFAYIGDFTVQYDVGAGDSSVDIGAAAHCVFERLRVIGGEAAMRLGYCITSTFKDCIFQNASKFGLVCSEPIFNQVSFSRCTFLSNTICGCYIVKGGHSISFTDSCGFESNGTCGLYANNVYGLTVHGSYSENNGSTAAHTFTTRAGSALNGGNWAVRSSIILNGTTLSDDTELCDDCHVGVGTSASITSSSWSNYVAGETFLCLAGVKSVVAEAPSDVSLASRVSINQPWVALCGASRALCENVRLYSGPELFGVDPIDQNADDFLASATSAESSIRGHEYSWVPNVRNRIDHTPWTVAGPSTWQSAGFEYQGNQVFELNDTAGASNFVTATSEFMRPEFVGKRCVWEVFNWVMSSSPYLAGLQLAIGDVSGTKYSNPAAATTNVSDVVTTGSITAATDSLVVADATGIDRGMPIVVAGAGTGGDDLPSLVTAVSGTTITLRDNAITTVSSLEVRQPALTVTRVLCIPHTTAAGGLTFAQMRRMGTNATAGNPIWVAKSVMRLVGSAEQIEDAPVAQYDTAAPTAGIWNIRRTVLNSAPTAGAYSGWVCTVAGSPGTWKGVGLIEA